MMMGVMFKFRLKTYMSMPGLGRRKPPILEHMRR